MVADQFLIMFLYGRTNYKQGYAHIASMGEETGRWEWHSAAFLTGISGDVANSFFFSVFRTCECFPNAQDSGVR